MPAQTAKFLILLVDDDPDVVNILNRSLPNAFPEAQFIAVYSFAEAVRYLDGLEGYGPRLVLLDINLQSELSGLDFLTHWRQHPQGRLVPVVVLSGDDSLVTIQEAYWRGANTFIAKPTNYAGWKSFVAGLRLYWYDVVSLPKLWFEKEAGESP